MIIIILEGINEQNKAIINASGNLAILVIYQNFALIMQNTTIAAKNLTAGIIYASNLLINKTARYLYSLNFVITSVIFV